MIFGTDAPLGLDGAAPLEPAQLAAATGVTLPDSPAALWRVIDAAAAQLAQTQLTAATEAQLDDMVEISERARRRMDGLSASLYLECNDRSVFRAAGYLSMSVYLSLGHRLGRGEANRRATLAKNLARHTALTGERLDPVLPATADAVSDGEIGASHVTVIAETLGKVPDALGPAVKADVEAQLVEAARTLGPRDLDRVGLHILAHIDPDGRYTDPVDRQRQRGVHLDGQDQQLMSTLTGRLTPSARAKLDLILNRWAAPGINNPDDPESPHGADSPGTADDGTLDAARLRDDRSTAQRNHDALEAAFDFILAHHGLGRPDRVPAELVITVSDEDLARHAGVALTSTGTLIPVADLVELAAASAATPYLAVFRHHTRETLYLGRGKNHRFASKAQRLALFARDRGCTAPGCDAPFARTQAHHSPDWHRGGRTDIDALGSACPRHNRWVGPSPGQWETDLLTSGPDAGRMVWRPSRRPESRHSESRGSKSQQLVPQQPGPRRPGSWQLNPVHHPGLLATGAAHAPPPNSGRDPVYRNDCRSRIEKSFEARLGFTSLTA